MSTVEQSEAAKTLVERFSLKAIVEACLVLEEGEAAAKDMAVCAPMPPGVGPVMRTEHACKCHV